MPLVNVKKKIEKHAAKLGIDEAVIAGCGTNPSGTMNKMMARELGGAIARAAVGGSGSVTNPDEGMAADFPEGQFMLVLTERRLLAVKSGVWTGAPKAIVAEWPRDAVVAIDVEDGRLAAPLIIAFSDGTAVQIEGAKGTDPVGFGAAFNAA